MDTCKKCGGSGTMWVTVVVGYDEVTGEVTEVRPETCDWCGGTGNANS